MAELHHKSWQRYAKAGAASFKLSDNGLHLFPAFCNFCRMHIQSQNEERFHNSADGYGVYL